MPRWLSITVGLLMLLGFLGFAVWLIIRGVKRSDDPARIVFKLIVTAVIAGFFIFGVVREIGHNEVGAFAVPLVAVVMAIVLSLLWTPHLGAMLARPLTSIFDGGNEEPLPQALYSVALAKRKAGKAREAILEIQQQLARFPRDVTGLMLLAEIQAEDISDFPSAQTTIERLCHQPGHAPQNIANALLQVADWHLKLCQDPVAAREALERIVALLPNTPQAHAAAQRLAHLGTTGQLLAPHDRATIELKPGIEYVGLLKEPVNLAPPEEPPADEAVRLVKQLEQFPLDTAARERLAVLYAEHYQRLDLAIGEIEQLITQPDQPPKQIVHYLDRLADFHVRFADHDAARAALQRIIDKYPGLAAAETARQRMDRLRLELKGKEKSQAVKLGSYDPYPGRKKS